MQTSLTGSITNVFWSIFTGGRDVLRSADGGKDVTLEFTAVPSQSVRAEAHEAVRGVVTRAAVLTGNRVAYRRPSFTQPTCRNHNACVKRKEKSKT